MSIAGILVKRNIIITLIVLVVAIVLFSLIFMQSKSLKVVKGEYVEKKTVISSINTGGTLAYEDFVTLNSEILAKVKTFNYKVGDVVKQGDVIIGFDSSEIDILVKQAENSLTTANQNLESIKTDQLRIANEDIAQSVIEYQKANDNYNAEVKQYENQKQITDAQEIYKQAADTYQKKKLDYERTKQLYEQGAATSSELENKSYELNLALSQYNIATTNKDVLIPDRAMKNAKYAMQQAESKLRQAENKKSTLQAGGSSYQNALIKVKDAQTLVDSANQKKSKSIILAPFNGIIIEDFIQVGELASVGAKIVTLTKQENLFLRASLDEKYTSQVSVGQRAMVYAQGNNDYIEGVVKKILPSADSKKGVIILEIGLLNHPDFLKNDMTVSADIMVKTFENSISISKKYLSGTNGRTVWKVAGKKVEIVEIEILQDIGDKVIINSGLNEGDWVIEPNSLKAGTKTTVVSD